MGPARFERRPTILHRREIMVGRRGEAPLVPPDFSTKFKKALALPNTRAVLPILRESATEGADIAVPSRL